MLEYMNHCEHGTILYYSNRKEIIHHRMSWVIEHWCFEHLFSYDGYKKAVKFHFNYHHQIPLYLCDEMMLIPIGRVRDYTMIWINHAMVKSCEKAEKGCKILFLSGREIKLDLSKHAYLMHVRKLEEIRNTKVKHFH